MSDVTRILEAIERGDPKAADELLPLVYDGINHPQHTLRSLPLVDLICRLLLDRMRTPSECP